MKQNQTKTNRVGICICITDSLCWYTRNQCHILNQLYSNRNLRKNCVWINCRKRLLWYRNYSEKHIEKEGEMKSLDVKLGFQTNQPCTWKISTWWAPERQEPRCYKQESQHLLDSLSPRWAICSLCDLQELPNLTMLCCCSVTMSLCLCVC